MVFFFSPHTFLPSPSFFLRYRSAYLRRIYLLQHLRRLLSPTLDAVAGLRLLFTSKVLGSGFGGSPCRVLKKSAKAFKYRREGRHQVVIFHSLSEQILVSLVARKIPGTAVRVFRRVSTVARWKRPLGKRSRRVRRRLVGNFYRITDSTRFSRIRTDHVSLEFKGLSVPGIEGFLGVWR